MSIQKKHPRTSAGLRDLLFDTIERLNSGDIDGTQAIAVAKVAREICTTVQVEIEVAKLRIQYPADMPLVLPAALQLGAPDDVNPETPKIRKVGT